MKEMTAGTNEAGQRLLRLAGKYLNEAPPGFLHKMLRKKNITLNGKKADGTELIQEGDTITFYLAEETIAKFHREPVIEEAAELSVLYEDNHVLLINKEAGMLSQKARPEDVSLTEALCAYLLQSGELTKQDLESFRPGLCNRLDRNTSGLVAAGKTLSGLQQMNSLIRERGVDKYYLCLVKGRLEKKEGMEGRLIKDGSHNRVRILPGGREGENGYIRTEYEPLCTDGASSLLKVKLITGKSHQIRAHLASLGHPLAGDGKYGDVSFNRYYKRKYQLASQLLHSWEMDFPPLSGALSGLSERCVRAPLPDLFCRILKEEFNETAFGKKIGKE